MKWACYFQPCSCVITQKLYDFVKTRGYIFFLRGCGDTNESVDFWLITLEGNVWQSNEAWLFHWAPPHGDWAFLKYEKWPDKGWKGTHYLSYMATPCQTIESVLIPSTSLSLRVESELDLAPRVEKLLTSPEVTFTSAQHCVKLFQRFSMSLMGPQWTRRSTGKF